jgi:hypothetical protein
MKRMKKVEGRRGLYKDAGEMFYERIHSNGRNSCECLDTTRQPHGVTVLDDRHLQRRAGEKGLQLVNPQTEKPEAPPMITVDHVINLYIKDG